MLYANLCHPSTTPFITNTPIFEELSDKNGKLRYNLFNFSYQTHMPNIYIKLKNISETVYFQSIMGTYSHIAWVRTQDPKNGIMQITPTEDQVEQVLEILNYLKEEIEFENVDNV